VVDLASHYYEQPLSDEDRAAFDCGKQPLTDYFVGDEIIRQIKSHDTAAFILRLPNDDRIAGYYTISNAAVFRSALPRKMRDNLRYNTTPALLIGRLARDVQFKGRGVGPALLRKAWERSIAISQMTGCAVVIVDTIDDEARSFYTAAGFSELPPVKAAPTKLVCECGREHDLSLTAQGSNYQMDRMYISIEHIKAALR
jgi:ribosomal protein S18 acetylase RimI-like enzyme